jgi:UDP-glucose 4-epimerase
VRYLITGGAGFIGSHLVDALAMRGDEVLVLDDLSTGRRENLEHLLDADVVELIEGSVLDEGLVDDCLSSVDACFHLASAVGVRLIVERPLESLRRNVRGTEVVISGAARRGKRLLFTSTSEVYGKQTTATLSEDSDRVLGSPAKSRWAYAIAKGFGEALAHAHHKEDGAPIVITRLFNTVGPRQAAAYGMVVPRFVRQAIRGEELTVYGNGTQSRCFVHVLDTVHAIMLLMDEERATGGVFNVGSTVELPIIELARRVIERSSARSSIKLVPYEEAYEPGFEELGRRQPDTTALKELTGWEPTRDIDEAIDDVIAYERSAASTRGRLRVAG